ncbi:hypothetical protein TKK_0000291 [Trichogramma kaykai]
MIEWALIRFKAETKYFKYVIKNIKQKTKIDGRYILVNFKPRNDADFNKHKWYYAKYECNNVTCEDAVIDGNHHHYHRAQIFSLAESEKNLIEKVKAKRISKPNIMHLTTSTSPSETEGDRGSDAEQKERTDTFSSVFFHKKVPPLRWDDTSDEEELSESENRKIDAIVDEDLLSPAVANTSSPQNFNDSDEEETNELRTQFLNNRAPLNIPLTFCNNDEHQSVAIEIDKSLQSTLEKKFPIQEETNSSDSDDQTNRERKNSNENNSESSLSLLAALEKDKAPSQQDTDGNNQDDSQIQSRKSSIENAKVIATNEVPRHVQAPENISIKKKYLITTDDWDMNEGGKRNQVFGDKVC